MTKRNPVNPSPALFLSLHHACRYGHDFAMQYPTMADVWDNCKRPDWLLWILDRLEMPLDKDRRLFACWCTVCTPMANGQTTRSLLTDPRSLEAVRVATLYAMGKATDEQRRYAADAAATAAYAASYATAAYAAAYAASYATADYTAAYAAAYAASYATADYAAAYAADYAAAYAAYADAARSQARLAQANQLRTLVPNPFR